MRINLLYLATKQLRFSRWLYEKAFILGTDVHSLKRYRKIDPSVAEIVAKQHGGKVPSYIVEKLQFHGHEVPDHLIEKPKPVNWEELNISELLEHRMDAVLAESKKYHEGEKK